MGGGLGRLVWICFVMGGVVWGAEVGDGWGLQYWVSA